MTAKTRIYCAPISVVVHPPLSPEDSLRSEAMSERFHRRFLASREIVRNVLGEGPVTSMVRKDGGKPVIPNGPEISISYTDTHAYVAVSEGEIGIDAVVLGRFSDALREWMTRKTGEDLSAVSDHDAFVAWSKIEAYCKYMGTGIARTDCDGALSLDYDTFELGDTILTAYRGSSSGEEMEMVRL